MSYLGKDRVPPLDIDSFVESIFTPCDSRQHHPGPLSRDALLLNILSILMLFVYLVVSPKRCHEVSGRTIPTQGTPMTNNYLVLPQEDLLED